VQQAAAVALQNIAAGSAALRKRVMTPGEPCKRLAAAVYRILFLIYQPIGI
jgi:hypothetical protein